MTERKEITLEEFEELRRNAQGGSVPDVEIEGMVVIKDKDGNIKSRLKLINLENEET